MRNHKLVVLLLAAIVITTVTATATMTRKQSRQSASDKRKVEDKDQAPVARFDEAEAANPEERAERLRKGRRYDRLGLVPKKPTGLNTSARSAHWTKDVPVIPSSQSDVVVVGQIVDAKAYLSGDKTGIYSEFAIKIEELLKIDGPATISNNTILAERIGGSIQYPSGEVQRIRVRYGQRMPQVGHRYLLFLKFTKGTQDLSILTGYELHESRVSALDNIEPYTAYEGSDEFSFLDEVRNSISSRVTETSTKRRQNQ